MGMQLIAVFCLFAAFSTQELQAQSSCDAQIQVNNDFLCLPGTVDLTFTGSNGTPDYNFTYDVDYVDDALTDVTGQTISTTGGASSVTANGVTVLGNATIRITNVTDANGCDVTFGPDDRTVSIQTVDLDRISNLNPTFCSDDLADANDFKVDLSDGSFFTDGDNEATYGDDYTVYYYNDSGDFDSNDPAANSIDPMQTLALEIDGTTEFTFHVVGFFDNNGPFPCFRTDDITFTVNENPDIAGTTLYYCEGDEVDLGLGFDFLNGGDDKVYPTQADAENETNEITDLTFVQDPGVEDYFV
ncbi:MAG: hypothetical protein AAFO07_15990, partial [Bacteroidota bacterium]